MSSWSTKASRSRRYNCCPTYPTSWSNLGRKDVSWRIYYGRAMLPSRLPNLHPIYWAVQAAPGARLAVSTRDYSRQQRWCDKKRLSASTEWATRCWEFSWQGWHTKGHG